MNDLQAHTRKHPVPGHVLDLGFHALSLDLSLQAQNKARFRENDTCVKDLF